MYVLDHLLLEYKNSFVITQLLCFSTYTITHIMFIGASRTVKIESDNKTLFSPPCHCRHTGLYIQNEADVTEYEI